MMAERGIGVAHTTIMRWVQRYIPEFREAVETRYARPVGTSWRIDETYIRVKGKWVYIYRGVDKEGQTIDFFLSEHRDMAAAKQSCSKRSKAGHSPKNYARWNVAFARSDRRVTREKSARCSHRAERVLSE